MVQIKFDWSVQLANGYRDPETQSNGSHYSLATHAKPYSVGSGHRTWFKAEIERERDTAPTPCEATERKRQLLLQLKSIGPAISALLSREVYYRQFANRRQVGSFLGPTPSPYSSGEEERCQGISRAGSKCVSRRPEVSLLPNDEGIEQKYSVSLSGDELKTVTVNSLTGLKTEVAYRRAK